jgi:hypothetical protein
MPALMFRKVVAAAAMLWLAAGAALASPGNDAIAFVRSLYAVDGYWNGVTADEATALRYLDAPLAELILANYARENVDATLSYDPLLQAQEGDDVAILLSLRTIETATASVNVTVKSFDGPVFLILDLVATPDGWRLADVHGSDGSSLIEELRNLNAGS